MQKKLIALAVAALASGAVFAQSNVSIYGAVDMGYAWRGSNMEKGVKSQQAINSNQSDASLIGFTGVEDLGNGTSALFVLEAGFKTDTGAHTNADSFFNEQAFVGLTGGWGTAIVGRLQAPRYGFLIELDPFGDGTVGRFGNVYDDLLSVNVEKVNNAVAYVSPDFGGFTVTAAYSTNAGLLEPQESIGNVMDLETWTVFPRYANGPLDVGFVYQYVKLKNPVEFPPASGIVGGKQSQWTIGGSYDFGAVKLSAAYDHFSGKKLLEAMNDKKVKSWMLGLSAPFGKNTVNFSYNESKADNLGKARQWAAGYDYSLSRRTNFYAAYSHITNKDERAASVGDAYNDGEGYRKGFQFGLRHSF
ncbi:MAG: porin [Betaproteobacteria bacterium]|nr:porin [Betaproteobacteria bacterium]